MVYRNGRIPPGDLATVQGGLQLLWVTAAAWAALVEDVRAETGVTLVISSPDGAYRSYARQEQVTGTGNHRYKPGYSVHGWGRAIDVWNHTSVPRATLVRLAAKHGFKFTIMPSEPWHMEHDGSTSGSGGGGSTPQEEEEMTQAQVDDIKSALRRESRPRLYRNKDNGQQMAIRVETGYVRVFSSPEDRDVLIGLGIIAPEVAVDVDTATYNGLIGEANKQLARIAAAVAGTS